MCLNFLPFKGWIIFSYMYRHLLYPFLSADTWVASTFWLLWIMLLWICVWKYLFEPLLSVFGGRSIPRSGSTGFCGNYIFNFLSHCHVIFYSFYSTYRSLHQGTLFAPWLTSPWRSSEYKLLVSHSCTKDRVLLAPHLSWLHWAFIASLSLFYFVKLLRGHVLEAQVIL